MRFDRMMKINALMVFFIVAIGIYLDQLTKDLAVRYLPIGKPYSVIDGLLNLSLVKNKGAAFGIGAGWSNFWRTAVFLVLSSAAVIFIFFLIYKSLKSSKFLIISLAMILSGAIGNVYDRLIQGYVIDFVEVDYKGFNWPNLNLADSLIFVGVIFYMFHSIFIDKGQKTKEVKKV